MSVKTYFENIAASIKEKNPEVTTVTPGGMPQAIRDIPSGISGIIFGENMPTNDIGSNGDYYYVRNKDPYQLHNHTFNYNANTAIGGYEFIPSIDMTITALMGYCRSLVNNAVLRIGNLSEVLASVTVNAPANEWITGELATPITLTAGQHYIIQIVGNSNTLKYATGSFTLNNATYVQGRYNSYPGTTEAAALYTVNALIERDRYLISGQYYKDNGIWETLI